MDQVLDIQAFLISCSLHFILSCLHLSTSSLGEDTDMDRKWNQRCLCGCSCQPAAAAGVVSPAGVSPEAVELPGVGLGNAGEAEGRQQNPLPGNLYSLTQSAKQ